MAIYQDRNGEYIASFKVRGHVRKVRLGTRDRSRAAWMETNEKAIARATLHRPAKGNLKKRSVWRAAYDYLWDYANGKAPGGVKNMYQALSTAEAYRCMPLRRFFQWKSMSSVSAADILAYQAERLKEHKGHHMIDDEIRALFRILRWAGLTQQLQEINRTLQRIKVDSSGDMVLSYALREPEPRPRLLHRKPRIRYSTPDVINPPTDSVTGSR